MKTCPICHSRCFDDMEICFGCMHRFDDGDEGVSKTQRLEIPIVELENIDDPHGEVCQQPDCACADPLQGTTENPEDQVMRIPVGQQAMNPLAVGYQLVISLQPVPTT